jgi:hypothetical protein
MGAPDARVSTVFTEIPRSRPLCGIAARDEPQTSRSRRQARSSGSVAGGGSFENAEHGPARRGENTVALGDRIDVATRSSGDRVVT